MHESDTPFRARTFGILVPIAVSLAALVAAPAAAGSILITGGSIVVGPGGNGYGEMEIVGTRGFSVTGTLTGQTTLIGPKTACLPCEPGWTIPLGAYWAGLDLIGTVATLDGVTYPFVGTGNSSNNLPVSLAAPTVTAPSFGSASKTMTAPFTFDSTFVYSAERIGPTSSVPVSGFGLATLTLNRVPGSDGVPDLWYYGGIRYDFADAAAPVPEPTSLVLLGSGLAFLVRRRVRA